MGSWRNSLIACAIGQAAGIAWEKLELELKYKSSICHVKLIFKATFGLIKIGDVAFDIWQLFNRITFKLSISEKESMFSNAARCMEGSHLTFRTF